jgi:hypothetical protein
MPLLRICDILVRIQILLFSISTLTFKTPKKFSLSFSCYKKIIEGTISVADPDPGSGIRDPRSGIRCLFDPWIRDPE